ncbi:MAG: ATP-dependent protease ATPase subunit HslU [Chloroflexi bacterium]|nr:ATP-dependent protease ATPase subunit HslU [Chloroflexota bacterium]
MDNLTPKAIVRELDKYVVGQSQAKKVVAIALRNRERRRHLSPELRQDVMPKNILMIGPTGVGKTEIARRMSALIDAPFTKVEATKFTEVGYVGRDVESIITDLVEAAVTRGYDRKLKDVELKAEKLATERIVDYLCQQWPRGVAKAAVRAEGVKSLGVEEPRTSLIADKTSLKTKRRPYRYRQFVANLVKAKQLEDQLLDIEVGVEYEEPGPPDLRLNPEDTADSFGDMSDNYGLLTSHRSYPKERRWRKVAVKDARRILTREEANRLVDFDDVVDSAIDHVEENGVVFIDELDKLAGPRVEVGRDVSGEGVQRDLLPIVEGTTVMTRFGPVKTEHVLFIAAGAFYQSKPADLIPELQGRFPLRVELSPLSQEDLKRILVEPRNALTKQYQALLKTEGIDLVFAEDAIDEVARLAALMNERVENIGARRLYTIMEKALEELNFSAPEMAGQTIVVDKNYVDQHVGGLVADDDLSRYIL